MEATGGRAHDIDGASEPYNRSARHARFSKTPTDLVATLDLPRNFSDSNCARMCSGHVQGQFAPTVRLRTGAGMFVDGSQKWNVRGHGKAVAVERTWKISERFLAAARFMRKLPGNCLYDSLNVARAPCRTTRELLRGRQPVCFVICGADFSGNCQVTCEPLRQPWCRHSPALCETFPANCSDTSSSCLAIAGMFHRILRGCYAGYSADTVRRLCGIVRSNPRRFLEIAGTRPGCCADTERTLPGCCPDDSVGIAPDAMPDAARKLRGHCSTCSLIF